MTRLPRALLGLACGLALVVLGTSSGLRLSADGLGCEPWPRCYERARAQDTEPTPAQRAVRLTHRLAASAFAVAAFVAVVLGWRRWSRSARMAGALLLLATAALAALGRITPSSLPAVTLANALGALVLLGSSAFLLAGRTDAAARGRRFGLPAALGLLLGLQAATGVMVSVRGAGAACSDGCAAVSPAGAYRLWHPMQPGSAADVVRDARAGSSLHGVHRLLAIVLIVAVAGAAARGRRRSHLLLGALALSVVSGAALACFDGALGPAVVHALAAGGLAAATGAWFAAGPIRMEVA